jgi:hypothetical protein
VTSYRLNPAIPDIVLQLVALNSKEDADELLAHVCTEWRMQKLVFTDSANILQPPKIWNGPVGPEPTGNS